MSNYESTLLVDYTNNCNLHCAHCYNAKTISEKKQTITFDKLLDLLETRRFGHIHFIGGEPLFDASIFDLIERIPPNITVSINTNGTKLVTYIDEISKSNKITEITISLDGFTAETNNSVRGENTFNTVLSNAKKLKDAINLQKSEILLTMAFTLLPSNINSYLNLDSSNFQVFDNLLISTPYWEGQARENYELTDNKFLDDYIIFFENIHHLGKIFKHVYFDTTPIFYLYLNHATTMSCNKEDDSKYFNVKNEVFDCGPQYTFETKIEINPICRNCVYFDECRKCDLGLYLGRSIYCEHLINKLNSVFYGSKTYKLKKGIIMKEINNEVHFVNLQERCHKRIASTTFDHCFAHELDCYKVKSPEALLDKLQIYRLLKAGFIE